MQHRCGHPRHVCGDPERHWFPQMDVCYVTREEQAAQAAYDRLHVKRPWSDKGMTSWAEKPDDEHPYHYNHGVTVWAATEDHGHGGNFTTEENPWSHLDGVDQVEGG